ncbi:retrovirus-related pol polyprotein from transposon TNT 1-94 [Tanacetum coccineum]|uniref:Retrovirus-related pol polyprotein from transposon TNT 1-94 n=1 Tax=Tanacetum coccineum TaxID=301880 RepID=A0ABQ5DV74_9ASTR
MFIPNNFTVLKLQTAEDLQGDALLHYDAEMELINLILLSFPNDIYNSVDACTSDKDMWKRFEREALVSVYNRFAQLMNDLERNDMHFPIVTINTKFLNSLQPEWLKYVTQVRLAKRLTVDTFDDLFDYLQQFEKLVNVSRAKKLEKSHDPLALIAYTGSSSRNTSSYYVTHPMSVVDYEDEYQQDDVHTNSEDPLTSAMLNKAIIQGDRVNIQSMNSGNAGRNNRRSYVQEEIVEGSNAPNETENVQRTLRTSSSGNTSTVQCYNCSGKGHYARNCPKPRVRDSKYFMEQMLLAKQDEAGVILTDEQNDFLFADASRMEEIEELSANICLMARIQPADNTSDAGPSYDSAFISEVQSSSNNENEEQMYPTHTKIINSTIGDDQIDSDIIFDSPNGNVNSGSIEKDTHVPDLCALEQLARNAYQEAEKQQIFAQKVQKQNTTLTSQLELYKERVQVLENINGDNNYLNEFLKADKRAKHFSQQAQSQFVRDRDIIRDLEKQRDKLDLDVKDYKRQNEELQKTHSILKRQMSENEDRYHDTVLDLEAKLKKNVDLILKLGNSLQGMFMLGPKPFLGNSEISLNIRDNEDTLDDASKNNSLHAEIEQLKKKSIEIQEGLQAKIKILEKDVQRCEKQSVDFELKLQHEKEKQKWDSSFKNKNTNPLDYSWISKMEKLEEENVSLDFTVQSLIKERDNVKLEYQKLFNSIKKTRSQTQTEMDELIAHVSEKTYAYGAIRAENQNLLFTISELKTRLANVEKGKSVNTKFDKTNGSQPLLCVTPLHKHVIQKKTDVQKSKENHVMSKPVTLQTSPTKQRGVNSNKNVIAPGMYKVVTTHESQTNEAKHNLSSTGMNVASSVRRPMNKDSHVKNSVLANSKKPAKKVAVYVRKNKQTDITSENVISNKESVIDVDVANASKAKTLLCVSCMQNVLIPCHDNSFENYKLNVRSNVRISLSTKSRTPKSYDTTYVVRKTRFSKESTLSKCLETTHVVSKTKIDVGSTSKANDKVFSSKRRNVQDKSLSTYMKNKIRTSQIWQKWFESKPNVVWSLVNPNPNGQNNQLVSVKKWVVKLHTYPCAVSSCVVGLGHSLFSVGQFCDGDLEVAFRSKTCYLRNLEGDDLLTGDRESNLYTISISDMVASLPVCLMSKATLTKSWLWHRRLSHLNFGTINDLTRLDLIDGLLKFEYGKDHRCSACERGKSKKASHPLKLVPSDHSKLELLHMDLCGPMRVASIIRKKYILVIVDDYSRYTWVYFLHSKDETPEIIKKFIAQAQLNYKAKVCKIRTYNCTEFKNATLKDHYEKLGIMQQFSTARTPQQNWSS